MYMVADSLRLMKKRYYVYPSSINIPKHFTIVFYSKFKKLWASISSTSICFSISDEVSASIFHLRLCQNPERVG